MSKFFQKYGFNFPVHLSFANIGEGDVHPNVPYIKPSNFIAAMSRTNDLHRILGGYQTLERAGEMLEEFWKRWRVLRPNHDVFKQGIPLSQCVPIYIHGDEGQHYKKSAVLICSWQPAIGFGSQRRPREVALPPEIAESGIPINFLRTAFQTRFLTALAPKDCSKG